ncbi:MAG TPA: serine/threonine-protein kinase [Anaeromyxobacter sp.]|nr:serine/threonine-protein kinase [Anaeromyxobacter sp.]
MRVCPECRNAVEDAARFCTSCGVALPPAAQPADPWLGRAVNGKFRIEALIGQGGMGRVYRARHLGLDRQVVLKMLHRAYSSDPQLVQRFQREARAASRLDHPNSIAVLDFGEAEDGTLFMAMEHLGGKDLARVIADEFPLGEPRIVRIGAQILSALAEAHARGIVHRDLKPENVMVEPRRGEPDFVKVLDFGIAKISVPGATEPRLTQAGLVCGTPEYMSPEQARGADLDSRSDLYSTGVILYQLATGELPFVSDTPVGFLTKHLSEAPVPARERNPEVEVSPALDAVIARALRKDPAARFQTADEMREALLACVRPAAPGRAPAPAATRASRPAAAPAARRRSRPMFWAFVAAMALAIAGGGTVAFLARERVAERRGHPDTVAPAQAGVPPAPAATPPAAPTATPPATATATPTPPATPPATATPTAAAPATAPATPTRTPTPTRTAPAPKVSRRDREKAQALFRKAEARRAAQDVDGAIKLYLAAEAADPGLAELQKKLALCYQLKGDRRRAAERYRRYLATEPDDADRVRAILATLQ